MGIQRHFWTFNDAIKLSKQDDAYKAARERDKSITQAVRAAFINAGYPVVEDFIQGSLATDTAILNKDGDFDIDRAVVIDVQDAPENPVDPKVVICDEVLIKRGFRNVKVKTPCVTADYQSENLHIDFPVYRKTGESYELAVGKRNSGENHRSWEGADPKGLKVWIKDKSSYFGSSDQKQLQFNRLVRYLKRWRNEQFIDSVASKIYSIGITVMVKQCFAPVFDDEGRPDDLNAVKSTVSNILNHGYFIHVGNQQYQVSVALPVKPWRDIFDGSGVATGTQFWNKLSRLHSKLENALTQPNERKKCEILAEMFGNDFPIPDGGNGGSKVKKASYSSAGVVGTSQGA